MSDLTLKLMNRRAVLKRRKALQEQFGTIAERLTEAYGTPTLGNFDDPVEEIFYIVLSAKTTDTQYRRTYGRLRTEYPTLGSLAAASVKDIKRCIAGGGLANKKAGQVKRIASRLTTDLGDEPQVGLRQMSAQEVFDYLTGLPGLGPKSALCVMMCSLEFDVFPVDVNVSRIAQRVGAVRKKLKHYHYQQMLPAAVPDGKSKELHVGLVVLGREVCLPRKPKCEFCVLNDLCNYGKKELRGGSDAISAAKSD